MKLEVKKINLKELIERETGRQFSKDNKMVCPFHVEKHASFSIKYNPNKDKYIWKCFGQCNDYGDAIDFIKKYKDLNYIEALEYLGISREKSSSESMMEKIEEFIKYQISNYDNRRGQKLLGLFPFVDQFNNIIYVKAKFIKENNEKDISYYHIDERGEVKNSRKGEEIPYNYYSLIRGIKENKDIVIVEGEKDVNKLKSLGYVATSFKGFSRNNTFDLKCFSGCKIIFIGDTGIAGEKYLEQVKELLLDIVKEFNVVELPGIEKLGDNADITDWLDNGHTKKDLISALSDPHDIKKSCIFKYVDKVLVNNEVKYKPKKVWQNLECLLKYKRISVKYNIISKKIEVEGLSNDCGQNAILADIHSENVFSELNLSGQVLVQSVDRIAKKYSYSPVQEYLDNCYKNWNGDMKNIDLLMDTIKTNNNFSIEVKELYIRKWLINCVKIAFNNDMEYGCEGVLVLQGEQGKRKTTWVTKLSPNSEWVKKGVTVDTVKKDDIMKSTNYWITELGELDATFKSDVKKLRSFITESKDSYRMPYERRVEEYARLTAFVGTVNDMDFLIDEAGNRRYWVLPVEKLFIEKFDDIDLEQFWGEVMHLWKDNIEVSYLTIDELKILNENNRVFEKETEEYGIVTDSLDWNAEKDTWIRYNPTNLANILNIKNTRNLKSALKKYEIHQKKDKEGRFYICPPLLKK